MLKVYYWDKCPHCRKTIEFLKARNIPFVAYDIEKQSPDMQTAYTRGTKVFIIRDSARCYVIPVAQMTAAEQSLVAQSFANCVNK